MEEIVVKLNDVCKSYGSRTLFDHYHMEIKRGEFIIVIGESGCGKSTLLNMIGLLDKADKGTIELFSKTNVKPFSKKAQKLLKDKIGYLFQNYALIDNETVYHNLNFVVKGQSKQKIAEALKRVSLEGYENKKIYQCSGGEQQRIAIARLLLKPCELILADEPTGSLDEKNKDIVMNLLVQLHNNGKTIILVTHDLSLKKYATQIIELYSQ